MSRILLVDGIHASNTSIIESTINKLFTRVMLVGYAKVIQLALDNCNLVSDCLYAITYLFIYFHIPNKTI